MSGDGNRLVRLLKGLGRSTWDRLWRFLPGVDREAFEIRPSHLVLEFTNLCNANCVFCPYSQQTRAHEFMSEETFKKSVADYVAMGGGSIDLTPSVGDPLIHPKFLEWVRYLRSIPQVDRITVTTNAILLGRHGVRDILDAGLSRINVSMAGFDEEMYRRVYRSDMYGKVLKNVRELLALNSERADPVAVYLCLRPDRPPADVLSDPDLQPLLAYDPKITFAGTFSRSGGLIDSLPAGMDLEPATVLPKREPCLFTYTSALIQSGGDVQICACESSVNASALVIGNIERESLREIWQSEKLRRLRESFRNGGLNSNCAQCDQYYSVPNLHRPRMRRVARVIRRRLSGEVVRHRAPVTDEWQME